MTNMNVAVSYMKNRNHCGRIHTFITESK
jgi:hypothetical protein